jgi:murein L,D-transpeptidase YcbB/YkuD
VKISFPASMRGLIRALSITTTLAAFATFALPARAESISFSRALAEASASEEVIAAFYRDRKFQSIWTSASDEARRHALFVALSQAGEQGLPTKRYDLAGLIHAAQAAVTEGDRGRLELAMTRAYLDYASDLSAGALQPKKLDPTILREIIRPQPLDLLNEIATSAAPDLYLRDLAPTAPQYARLIKEKLRLEHQPPLQNLISASKLKPKDQGDAVIVLRDRLIDLGYLSRTASASYDAQIMRAVQRYQLDQGLIADGVAGASTINALNTPPADRLKSVIVSLERMRWMGHTDLGARHIWVNQPTFTAEIVDDGRVTFETRVVIGKNDPETRSPEFSDQMEYMVINPSWGVPRSIIVKEYLPMLQRNRNAVGQLDVVDSNGNIIPRGSVNFAAYTASSFPFGLRQAPSDGNALGKVKFMFPNPYNIYLHDTPAKALFSNEVRAFSHGCIRVGSPMDFAYALLAKQSDDPKGLFKEHLDSKNENSLSLQAPVPVHLVYYTAWPNEKGSMSYARDVYGRDAVLFDALIDVGVELPQAKD